MQITHEEARKLIQFDADDALNSQEKVNLYAHIEGCIECRAYANDIKEVESILLPVMRRQWNIRPIPLSMGTVYAKRNDTIRMSMILATRTIAIGTVLLAFIFSVWQFTVSGAGESSPVPMSVPPIPTPSTQSTSTKITVQDCTGVLYTIQENDTLESIAYQFSTSREDLMAANHLNTETVSIGMELIVPICNLTPTGTIRPATLTTTYTPSISPTTFTPDG
ncbi:MAG TPA: LysM peptidoglycan-binding domain-containing protein [Anaerolineales bacterium]|nr:LysM peptidoglycan-binding domain-containing protein [Anaerolineales bacterium]